MLNNIEYVMKNNQKGREKKRWELPSPSEGDNTLLEIMEMKILPLKLQNEAQWPTALSKELPDLKTQETFQQENETTKIFVL